jgi:hypothetical protein
MATKKELFERIIETMDEDAEVVEMCEKYIEALSAPRKKTVNKAAEEFAAGVATWMSEHEGPHTLKEVAEDLDVSWQKINAAMTRLIHQEVVVSIPGEKSKDPKMFVLA